MVIIEHVNQRQDEIVEIVIGKPGLICKGWRDVDVAAIKAVINTEFSAHRTIATRF